MKKRQANRNADTADATRPDETDFAAWESNPQAQALRVDLQSGAFFVLPYSHFALAHFDRDENGESLRIALTTHEVRVSGRHLRELGIALQRLAVEWIREVPPRYAALAEKGHAFIERIEVAEIEDEENARLLECARCSGGGNSPGETRSSQRVGSSRGSCEELAELLKPPETTAVAGLKCETGGVLPP